MENKTLILQAIATLRGGTVHQNIKNGLQNPGVQETGRKLYQTFDYRIKRKLKLTKLQSRVLNQEELLFLVQQYFELKNANILANFLTTTMKGEGMPQFQFQTHFAEKLGGQNLLRKTVKEQISLSLLLKVYTEDAVRKFVSLRAGGGSVGSVGTTRKSIEKTLLACEKVSNRTHISLTLNKKVLVLVAVGLVLLLIVGIFLFVRQQKFLQNTLSEGNKEILSLKKKVAGCNAEKALQFIENTQKIEKIPGLEKSISEKTASLKRLTEKIKRICDKTHYVFPECKEFDRRTESELRKLRDKWFEDLNAIPKVGFDDEKF
jgi:hypothetical protein